MSITGKKNIENINTRMLNNMVLNSQEETEEIKEEVKQLEKL